MWCEMVSSGRSPFVARHFLKILNSDGDTTDAAQT